MTTSIQNNGLPNFPAATSGTGNASGSAPAAVESSPAATPKAGDQLKLTDSARALQEAARLDTSSAIDSKRVEQIRQSLADGSYQVDAGRIADRMLSLDRQLGNTGAA